MVTARAEDVSGNLSALVSHPVAVVDDQPPTGGLEIDHIDGIYPNHVLGITITANDDHGLRTAHLIVSGAATGEWTFDPNDEKVLAIDTQLPQQPRGSASLQGTNSGIKQ